MSCGRSQFLEALALGQAPPSLEAELTAHLRDCGRCRHELRWLKTEQALFRQRAGRDEVAHLWKGVARRSGLELPRVWPRALAALALGAAVLLAVGPWRAERPSGPQPAAVATGAPLPLESETAMSLGPAGSLEAPDRSPVCSTLPEGLGFHCGPVQQASVVASR
jgi:anti-sigma factor RsiW